MNKKLQDLLGAIEGSIERQFKTGAYPPNIPEHSIQLLKSDIVQWIRTDKTLHNSLDDETNKRYERALDYIALVAMKKDHHLGRPRSSDKECIFCLAYLALNDGAYGESFAYKALAEEMRKRPPFTATDTV